MKRETLNQMAAFTTRQVAQMHPCTLAGFQLAGYRQRLGCTAWPRLTDVAAQNRLLLASFLSNLEN